MISFVYSHRKIWIIVLVTFVVWHVSTVARKGQTKRWLNRAKSTPGGKTGNTEMTPRWKQTNQQRLGEDEIHGGGNKNRDRRREAKRDTWGEKKKTGKNQSMTVFASNIQPFNWVIDLMRWTSWMRKVKTFPRRDPNCTTKKTWLKHRSCNESILMDLGAQTLSGSAVFLFCDAAARQDQGSGQGWSYNHVCFKKSIFTPTLPPSASDLLVSFVRFLCVRGHKSGTAKPKKL